MAVGRRALAVIVAIAVALVTGSTIALASTGQAAGEPAPARLQPVLMGRAAVGGLAWHGPGAELGEYAASITAGAIGIADQPRLAVSGRADTVRIGKYATSAPAAISLALIRGNAVQLVGGVSLPAAAGVYPFSFVDGTGAATTLAFQAGDRLGIVNDSAAPLPVIGKASTAYSEEECFLDASDALTGCTIATVGWRLQVDLGVGEAVPSSPSPSASPTTPAGPSGSASPTAPTSSASPTGSPSPTAPTDPATPSDPSDPGGVDPGTPDPQTPVTDCPTGIAADGWRIPRNTRAPKSLVGFDLAKDGGNRLRGTLVTSLTDNLVERLPSGRGAYYSSSTRAAAYSLAGATQAVAWSEHHDVTLDSGLLVPCEAVYATLRAGGPAQPLLWAKSGGLDRLDAAVDGAGRLALVVTNAAPFHKDVRALYWPAVRKDGAYDVGTGTRLPLRGVETVRVATAGGRVVIAAAGFGRMAVYTGPITGQLREVFRARQVDPALDVAVGRGGKPVVAYASDGRLHLLVGGRDVDTRYPAYGAAMALSKSGTVAHLAWSVKPTAAPCSTRSGLLYNCAGRNALLVADAALANGRPRHVGVGSWLGDGVAPQVVVGPGDRAAAYYIPPTSRRLVVRAVP